MFMTNQQPTELTQPSIRAFDDPAALISPQLPPIFVTPLFVVFPVRHDQIYASFLQALPQRVGIISAIGNYPLRFLPRPAPGTRDLDLLERGFRKCNFSRRGTFQPNSQRNTFTVDQYHPLCALAPLGFTDRFAPFFAAAKLPSKNVSSQRKSSSSSSNPNRARQAFSHTSCSSHCCNRRQQVEGEGNSLGKNRHAAPVCKIHRMPSKHARFGAHGRPRLSRRRLGSGNRYLMTSHRSSVRSFCRDFMTKAEHQIASSKSAQLEAESIYETRSRKSRSLLIP